jgi:hypothetical protein
MRYVRHAAIDAVGKHRLQSNRTENVVLPSGGA